MKTKTDDITLPPLPYSDLGGLQPDSHASLAIETWGRAAVEADRQQTAAQLRNPVFVHANMCRNIIAPITFDMLAHVLGEEATEAWLADHSEGVRGMVPSNDDLLGCAGVTRSSQPAASAEPPKLTDDEIERLVIQLGVTWKEDAWKVEDADLHPMVRALLYRYTATPVAQEPVGDPLSWLETEIDAVSCRHYGDPAYDHDAYWFRRQALKLVAQARRIFATPVDAQDRENRLLKACRRAVLALAAAAEKDPAFQGDYDALSAAIDAARAAKEADHA